MRDQGAVVVAIMIGACMGFCGSDASMQVWGFPLFALCTAFAFVIQWLVFIPSFLVQTEHYYDLTGSLTYIIVIGSALFLGQASWLQCLMGGMVLFWAIRLGSFLFARVKRAGGDSRFEKKNIWAWFLMCWTLQGLWVVLTSAPVVMVLSSSIEPSFHPLVILGGLMWSLGMIIEIMADHQKTKFRNNPENKGKFITTGLWGMVRHPNYAGEILLWFGLAVMSMPYLAGLQYAALISPVFVFVLLRYISGVPFLTEAAQKKWGDLPEFQEYMANTPLFIPRWK